MLLYGCESGDDIDVVPTEQHLDTLSVGVYVKENSWIYSQMHHHYLWYEDMPDSLSCDYLLDPVSFFKSLLSPRDRFSYCEHNENYTPETSGISELLNLTSVLCDTVYYVGRHRIGYLCYLSYQDVSELEPVMKHFYDEKITEMVLDLRYNGGGLISTCQYLCSSIVPELAYGQQMEYLRYNNIVTQERLQAGKDSIYSYMFKKATDGSPTLGHQIYGLRLKRLHVLVSRQTASASESTIICLKPYMNVVTIGEPTVGKGVGMETLYNTKNKYKLVPITFQYYNTMGETVPDEGLIPDVRIDELHRIEKKMIGKTEEPGLATALDLIIKSGKILKESDLTLLSIRY